MNLKEIEYIVTLAEEGKLARRAKTFYHPIRTDPAGQQSGA